MCAQLIHPIPFGVVSFLWKAEQELSIEILFTIIGVPAEQELSIEVLFTIIGVPASLVSDNAPDFMKENYSERLPMLSTMPKKTRA